MDGEYSSTGARYIISRPLRSFDKSFQSPTLNEYEYDKIYETCAPNKDSGQPAQLYSLIRVFANQANALISLGNHLVWSETSLSAWMPVSLSTRKTHNKNWPEWANV